MRHKEGMYLAHCQRNSLLGLLPREHTYFGLRREHRGLHGDSIGMRRNIIWQNQYRCLAGELRFPSTTQIRDEVKTDFIPDHVPISRGYLPVYMPTISPSANTCPFIASTTALRSAVDGSSASIVSSEKTSK